jgi:hypothetical protein
LAIDQEWIKKWEGIYHQDELVAARSGRSKRCEISLEYGLGHLPWRFN